MYTYLCINFPVMLGDYFIWVYEYNHAGYALMEYKREKIYSDASKRKNIPSITLALIDNDTFSNRVLVL